jgi:hypothetical protein
MHIGVENRENEPMMENIAREVIQDVLESEEMEANLFDSFKHKPAPVFASSITYSNPPGCDFFMDDMEDAVVPL